MARVPRILAALAVLALVLPAAAAGVGVRGELTATRLQTGGSGSAVGPVVAFLQEAGLDSGGADPVFWLDASEIRLETDSANLTVHGFVATQKEDRSTTQTTFSDATVTGTENRDGYRWDLFSTDPDRPATVEAASTCFEAGPARTDSIERLSLIYNEQHDTIRDTSEAVALDICTPDASLRITGDFVLSLWQWDARLTAANETHSIETGPRRSPYVPTDSPDLSAVVSRDVEAYLYVTNGTLTVPRLAGPYQLLTGPGSELAASRMDLRGATGRIEVGGVDVALQQSAVRVDGHSRITLAGRGPDRPFQAVLAGDAGRISVDGSVVAMPASDGARWIVPASGAAMLAVLAYIGLHHVRPLRHYRQAGGGAALAPAPRTARQRRGAGYAALARRATVTRRYRTAFLYSWLARRLFPDSIDAALIRIVCLYNVRRYGRCIAEVTSTYSRVEDGAEKAELACVGARAFLETGARGEALEWLRKAYDEDPSMIRMATSGDFQDLSEEDWREVVWGARSASARRSSDPAFG